MRYLILLLLLLPTTVMGDVTVISGTTDSEDAQLGGYAAVNSNYGASVSLSIASRSGIPSAKFDRMVIRFDESVYTAGAAAIQACTLWVYVSANAVSGSGTNIVFVSPIAAANDWVEGVNAATCPYDGPGVTWNKLKCHDDGGSCLCEIVNVAWAGSVGCGTSGTDYLTSDTLSVNWTGAGQNDWFPIDVTAMTTAWVAGTYTNQGMLLQNKYAATTGNEATLTSRSSEWADFEPRLEITWSTGNPQVIIPE